MLVSLMAIGAGVVCGGVGCACVYHFKYALAVILGFVCLALVFYALLVAPMQIVM